MRRRKEYITQERKSRKSFYFWALPVILLVCHGQQFNPTCPTKTCTELNEVCENGYCKIKIEGTCIVDQTTQTTTIPPKDTLTTAKATEAKERNAVIMTVPPMTNEQECVQNSLCTRSTGLTCQCKDGYAKNDNGFCQEARSSASCVRLKLFTSVMVTLYFYISL